MLREFLLIFVINYIGVIIAQVFHLPIPGTILGMLLLFGLLYTKILKVSSIERASNFLLLNMTIFFLPPAVGLLETMYLLKNGTLKIIFLVVFSTLFTMIVTAKTVEFLIKKVDKK
ncbi:CidA/LrgA family protein [Fusobacterium sp.]|uniref:CidA/LrgA family protein n=1 Tax=Fusobacterium sp. TaxID=68766 RepID=UPI00396C57F5